MLLPVMPACSAIRGLQAYAAPRSKENATLLVSKTQVCPADLLFFGQGRRLRTLLFRTPAPFPAPIVRVLAWGT
eukprot:6213613-Pleurochrysis_carterae.AAC.2